MIARQAKKEKNDTELDSSMLLRNDIEYNSDEDDEYDPDKQDNSEETLIDCFSQEWVESLGRDFSDRTVREWRSVFLANNGAFPDTTRSLSAFRCFVEQ